MEARSESTCRSVTGSGSVRLLRLGRLGGEAADRRELVVQVLARAGGGPGVAVPVDGLEGAAADVLRPVHRVDARHAELPGEQRAVGPQHRLRGARGLEVADRRHRERVVVVAEGVGADDRARDPAVAALPDPAELVDQEVVADVAPALGLGVVRVDAAQHARDVVARVVVGVDRVVHESGADRAVARAAVAHPLVGAPLLAGEDRRPRGRRRGGLELDRVLAGGRRLGVGHGLLRGGRGRLGLDLGGPAGRDDGQGHALRQPVLGDRAQLHPVDLADEHRVGAGPGAGALRGLGSGACSSWYSSSLHPVHAPPVAVRTCSRIWSSATCWSWDQVTPTAP